MKAMILAAGRGERMRPLTDHTPKPLLLVAGKPLISYHLSNLKKIGIDEVVINISYRAEQIQNVLGDGSQYGIKIIYSFESTALETGGGIYQALPLLGNDPFIIINADVWTDYPLQNLPQQLDHLAHLILVDSPAHNTHGDFYFDNKKLSLSGKNKLTYSGIGVYRPDLFQNCQAGAFRLADVLKPAIAQNKISGEHYHGEWIDIGTPERLEFLNQKLILHDLKTH